MKKNKKFKSLSLLMALLMIVISVFIAPTATAEEESATTPLIVSEDYEKLVLDYENFEVNKAVGAQYWSVNTDVSSVKVVEDGTENKVLKVDATQADKANYVGFYLDPNKTKLSANKNYRISGKFKVVDNGFNIFYIGIANSAVPNSIYNGTYKADQYKYKVYDDSKPYANTETFKEFASPKFVNGGDEQLYQVVNLYLSYTKGGNNRHQILFDDIVYAEKIDTVTAISANPTFGDVSVVNKNSTLEGFAVGETAVFTATPKAGYKFVGWVDENGNAVEGGKTLEVVLESDTSLTAKFAEDEESTLRKNSDIYVDFENVTTIYTTDSDNFTVVEEAGAEETNKVLYYKGSADTDSSKSDQNRISFTRTDVNTKLITEIAKPGEYITIRFRYKYSAANTASGRFYFQTIADSGLGNIWNSEDRKTSSYEQTITNNGTEWQTMSVTLKIIDSATDYDNLIAMIAVPGDIYFDDIQVYKPIDTAYNGVGALRAASSSATGKNGLRIYNNIDKSHSNDKSYAENGSIAVRKEKLSKGDGTYKELTHSTTGYVEGVAFKRENWSEIYKKVIKIDDQGYTFTSYLVNIKPEFYDDVYVVRAYQKVAQSAEAFATAAYEYGDEVEVCVFDLANKIDNNPAASEIDKTAFYDFVNRDANGTDTVALYKTWAKANGRTTGALYAALIAE